MNTIEPMLRVPVDVTNPGQFFACCGLLELAHRLNNNAQGWFEAECFSLAGAPANLVQQFLACDAKPVTDADSSEESEENESTESAEGKTVPIQLGAPFNLYLDWWNSAEAQRAKLKTWSAGQKVTDLLNGKTTARKTKKGDKQCYAPGMRDHFKASLQKNPDDWLRAAEPIASPKPFCFDSRLSRKNALDLGHAHESVMAFSPAVDVLTLIGLQRFRPLVLERWTRNLYCTWRHPIQADIAAVVTLGLIPQHTDACFEFPVKPCDAKGRYKLFGNAQPVRRPHV